MDSDTQFRWSSAASSHVGLVRQVNEDSYLDHSAQGLWVVADGMGGHTRGDVASRMVVEALGQLIAANNLAQLATDVRDCLQQANRQLRIEAAMRDVHIIGSTVVVLLAYGRQCCYIWAGDSRIYLYRKRRLIQLTRDHSQLEEWKSSGTFADEFDMPYPARNLITRAVGAADTLELEQEIINVSDGDVFLLCSDGVSNEVSEHDMCAALELSDCHQAVKSLVELALAGGGRDNISAIVVRADDVYSTEKTLLNPALSQ